MSSLDIENDGTLLKYAPSNITSVEIPSTIKIIYGKDGDYAFQKCSNTLTSFSFQSNPQLEYIQGYAFHMCTELRKIDLSTCKKLLFIGEKAFYKCYSVTK